MNSTATSSTCWASATPGRAAERRIAKGSDDDPFLLYEAWRSTGDTAYLEKVYGDEITTAEQRMWMVTEAHWWSDRVELFSDILQRSRLGAMALRPQPDVPRRPGQLAVRHPDRGRGRRHPGHRRPEKLQGHRLQPDRTTAARGDDRVGRRGRPVVGDAGRRGAADPEAKRRASSAPPAWT
jgi:hypothetical protein